MSATADIYSPIARPARPSERHRPNGSALPHAPWVCAVLAAPFLLGAVRGETLAALALAIALSLICGAARLRPIPRTVPGKAALFLFMALALSSLLPLPRGLLEGLSPEAARLAEQFSMTPRLSLAPGETVVRLWQLGLAGAVFVLARTGALAHRFTGMLAYGLCAAVIGQGVAEFWFLFDGHGIWREVRHYPGGTFANRNHFAGWMAMGSMVLFGALARKLRRLRREPASKKQMAAAALLAAGLLCGIAAVIACGSRGGMLALAAGLTYWIAVLFRQRSRGVAAALVGLAVLGGAAAFAVWGGLFMERLTGDALGFKLRIWRDTLAVAAKFPLFGIGLGAFEPVFGIYKTFHGEGTFLFAENEYLQWLVELGAAGAAAGLLAALATGRGLCARAEPGRFAKPEFFHGAIAALAAFGVQAAVEFVGQVPATLLLAAALLGLAVGLKERATGPEVIPAPGKAQFAAAILLAVALAGLAAPQLRAGLAWRGRAPLVRAGNPEEARQRAFGIWPLEKDRAIVLARQYVALGREGQMDAVQSRALAGQALDRALAWHPLDWRLRLERSWLSLAEDPAGALAEALLAMEANPRQAQIPLRFAASLAVLHPASALEVLRRGNYSRKEEVARALEIGWGVSPSIETLRGIAPATAAGMEGLGQFARARGFGKLAAEAAARKESYGNAAGNRH